MEPARASGPSHQARISWTSAKGEVVPAWPPAPAATAISPSAPFSTAFRANRSLMMSCRVMPPPAVHGLVQVLPRPQRGDDHRHFPLGAGGKVGLQTVVGFVYDLVHRKGSGGPIGKGTVVGGQLLGDPVQPLVQHRLRPGIQRRKSTDNPCFTLGDHQIGVGDDEQRRADHRQPQAVLKQGGHAHGRVVSRRRGRRFPLFRNRDRAPSLPEP